MRADCSERSSFGPTASLSSGFAVRNSQEMTRQISPRACPAWFRSGAALFTGSACRQSSRPPTKCPAMSQPWPWVRFGARMPRERAARCSNASGTLKTRLRPKRRLGQHRPIGPSTRSQGLASWPWRSACQHWRLVNEALIVDLPDKKVRHVGARDEPGAPIARID
jgi:hypothetical protein